VKLTGEYLFMGAFPQNTREQSGKIVTVVSFYTRSRKIPNLLPWRFASHNPP